MRAFEQAVQQVAEAAGSLRPSLRWLAETKLEFAAAVAVAELALDVRAVAVIVREVGAVAAAAALEQQCSQREETRTVSDFELARKRQRLRNWPQLRQVSEVERLEENCPISGSCGDSCLKSQLQNTRETNKTSDQQTSSFFSY